MPQNTLKLSDFFLPDVVPHLKYRKVSPEPGLLYRVFLQPANNTTIGRPPCHTDIYNVVCLEFWPILEKSVDSTGICRNLIDVRLCNELRTPFYQPEFTGWHPCTAFPK